MLLASLEKKLIPIAEKICIEDSLCIYRCNEESCQHMAPNFFLNSIIKEIILSYANKTASYKDNNGEIHIIKDNYVSEFLFKKPELVVTSEGMLVFYADNTIMITFDMNFFMWEYINESLGEGKIVDKFYIEDGKCTFDTSSEYGKMKYQFLFKYDFTKSNPIGYVLGGWSL